MRSAVTTALWTLIGFAVALATVTSIPSLAGMRSFTVLSGSMEPTLRTGSVILVERIRPGDTEPGDIVTFPDPANRGRLITHRLRDVTVRGDKAYMVTRGDANRTAESWNVPLSHEIGRARVHLPLLGYPRTWLAGFTGRMVVVAILLLWGALAVAEIWRAPRKPDAEASAQLELGATLEARAP